jgi:hypothetical protein
MISFYRNIGCRNLPMGEKIPFVQKNWQDKKMGCDIIGYLFSQKGCKKGIIFT